MSKQLKKGDKVRWKSHGGEAVGVVERKITSDTNAAAASPLGTRRGDGS